MKKFLILGMLGALALAWLAYNAPFADGAFANNAPTATPRATRVRKPKPTVTATPVPESIDEASAANEPEISPVSPGAMTSQIVVFNPDTSGAATVQIDIYDSAGNVAYTTTVTVNANGAKIITLPSSLGTNFQGSAAISSDKNIQALAVAANGTNTARDAYEGMSAPATNLVVPFARHLAANTQNSILAIQNTTASAADVYVTFYDATGSAATAAITQSLSAHQPLYLNTNTIFPSATFTGSIGITSTQNIAAALQTRYFKDTGAIRALASGNQDTIVYLNALQRKLNATGVPQSWTEIFVRNNGTNATDITIEFFTNAGASLGTQTASAVPANGSAQFLLNDSAFALLGSSYAGWAKISSTGEPLVASSIAVISKGKRMTSVDGLANAQVTTRYVCGDTSRNATQTSQLTLLNTEARNAKVLVRLYDPNSGAQVAQATIILLPRAATTIKLSDPLFAAAGTNFQGMTLVRAKGTTPPKIIAAVTNPYGSSKLTGTTGYVCGALP